MLQTQLKSLATLLVIGGILTGVGSCRRKPAVPSVRVFHAAGFGPIITQIRDAAERDLHIKLETEGSGSQEACRKVTELGRTCDALVLADNRLVKHLLGKACTWRIDFAADEVVLGVGARAPNVAEAEKDWTAVILKENVRLARVDENLGPIGYRTLLVLKLAEQLGHTGIHDQFLKQCQVKVDDVERVPPLLRGGDIDYAFLYRSTCIAHGIRFIALDQRVNLSSPDVDYSQAVVQFAKLKSGNQEMVTVHGAACVWSIVQPRDAGNGDGGAVFIQYLLAGQSSVLDAAGFRPFTRAKFYGSKDDYTRFAAVADYAGEME